MSEQKNSIDDLNKKLTLMRNLTWLSGALFAGTVFAAGWAWSNATSEFVKYDDDVRVKFVGSSNDLYLTSGKQRAGGDTYEVTNDAGSATRWELVK